MIKLMLRVSIAIAAAVVVIPLVSVPAQAGPATGPVNVGDEFGDTLRARFHQNVDGSGYKWTTWGSSVCTSGTGSPDFSWSDMDAKHNWNDVVSYIRDYNQCDVKIYRNAGFGTALTGYVHYGTGGRSLGGTFSNNRTSSYRVS